MLINFVVYKPMAVSGSWCCTLKKHYAVLSSNSHIPNFELQSHAVYMVCGQYVVLIDMAARF